MTYKYNPSVTETVDAYSVAYSTTAMANAMLIGAMWGRLTKDQQETVYREALDKVREDMKKAGQL